MSEVTLAIRASHLFREITQVIDADEAYLQLLRVVLVKLNRGRKSTEYLEQDLLYAFDWENTPQGRSYWARINRQLDERK